MYEAKQQEEDERRIVDNVSVSSKSTISSDDLREIVSDPLGLFTLQAEEDADGGGEDGSKGFTIDGFFGTFLGFRLKNLAKRFSMDKFRSTFHSVRESTRLIKFSRDDASAVEIDPSPVPPPINMEELNLERVLRPEMYAGLIYSPSIYSRPGMDWVDASNTSSLSVMLEGDASDGEYEDDDDVVDWETSSTASAATTEADIGVLEVDEQDEDYESSILSILEAYTPSTATATTATNSPSEHDPHATPQTMDSDEESSPTAQFDSHFADQINHALQTHVQYGINSSICDICRQVTDLRLMPARFSYLNQRGLRDYIEDAESTEDAIDSFYPGEGGPIYLHNPQTTLSPVLEASPSEESLDLQERYEEKRSVFERLGSACMRKHGHCRAHVHRYRCFASSTSSLRSIPNLGLGSAAMGIGVGGYSGLRRGDNGMGIDEGLIVDEFDRLYGGSEGGNGYGYGYGEEEDDDEESLTVDSYSWLPRLSDLSSDDEDEYDGESSGRARIGSASVYSGTKIAPEDVPPPPPLGAEERRRRQRQNQQKEPRMRSWMDKVRKDPRYIWLGGLIAMFEMIFMESGTL